MGKETREERAALEKGNSWTKHRKTLLVGVGTLILGVGGNAVWELAAKPGLTWLGSTVLSVATLGSTAIRDKAYADAALDPTPLASLQLLGLFYTLLFATLIGTSLFTIRRTRRWLLSDLDDEESDLESNETSVNLSARMELHRSIVRRLGKVSQWLSVLSLFLGAWNLVTILRTNQSVLIWRTFHANLRICAPFISDGVEEELRSKFAQVKGKSEFDEIHAQLMRTARMHGVAPVDISLW